MVKIELELYQDEEGYIILKKDNFILEVLGEHSLFTLPINEIENLNIDKLMENYFYTKEVKEKKSNKLSISATNNKKYYYEKRKGRLQLILDSIKETETKSSFIFKSIRIKGYSHKNKTFYRDLIELEENGFIEKKINYGGNDGTYSIITKLKSDING